MPELHKLMPVLRVLQKRGFVVGLVTDGRMSGASGVVPCAIHMTPEAIVGGFLGKIKDGDYLTIDATRGNLAIDKSEDELNARVSTPNGETDSTFGRGLFSQMRNGLSGSEQGASFFSF